MKLNLSVGDMDFYLRQLEKVAEDGFPSPMTFDGWVMAGRVLQSGAYTSVDKIKNRLMGDLKAKVVGMGYDGDQFDEELGLNAPEPETPLHCGDSVYYVPRDQRWDKPQHKYVTGIGRKWIYCGDDFRFDKVNLKVDGGRYPSPGKIYRQASDYEDKLRLDRKYAAISKTFDCYSRRDQFDEDQLDRVIAILGIDINALLGKK